MAPVPFRVARRRRETARHVDARARAASGRARSCRAPGQFTMLYAFGIGEVPISVSGDGDGPLVHTVRAVGRRHPRRSARREPGAVLGVRGPFGNAWPVERRRRATSWSSPAGSAWRRSGPRSTHVARPARRLRRGRAPLRQPDARRPALPRGARALAAGSTSRSTSRSTPPTSGWHGKVGVVAEADRRRPVRPGDSTVAFVCGPEIMMRFAARALLERGVPLGADLRLDGAEHAVRLGHCGHCQLGPTLICRDGARLPLRRARAADGGAGAVSAARSRSSPSGSSPRATAASSRCSTARTSCSRSRARSRSPTSSRRPSATVEGPVRPLARRGLGHDRRTTPSGSRRCGAPSKALVTIGACATAGGIQALRNFADVDEFVSIVYASPDYISTLETSTPISAHVPVDFELHGCPIDKRQLLEVVTAFLHGRRPNIPSTSVCMECKRRGTRLRDGRPRDAVPRAGHARRLRRDLPGLRPRLLRLLRADGDAEHGLAHEAAAGCSGWATTAVDARLPHLQRRRARSRRRADGHEPATKTIKTDYLARVEGEGAMLVRIRDGEVEEVKLNIYEPPRFFEAFLRGRALHRGARHHRAHLRDLPGRLPDELGARRWSRPAASRSAAQLARCAGSSTAASGSRATRCTSSCSTRPTSSATTSAIELARDHRELVASALAAEEDGQRADDASSAAARCTRSTSASAASTGRRASAELAPLVDELERAREIALETVRFTAGLDFPDYEQDYELVALAEPGEYPIDRGRIVSNRGLDIAVSEYERALRRGARRVVERAALARCASAAPTSSARSPASRSPPTGSRRSRARRPRRRASAASSATRSAASSCARVELVYAADEALRLIAEYEEPDAPAVEVEPARRRRLRLHRGAARASSTTATRSTTRARSSTRRSCRRPRRTSGRSRRTCAASSSARSTSPTTSSRSAASRRSATTTPASPARRTS